MNTAGPPWAPSFSPYATFGEVPTEVVRQALRQQWRRWGLPKRLRVDNGVPWGNWNDLPTLFALWAVGVGVDWHWNDPCCPQQNPKIERSQGTAKNWGEPKQCDSVAQLQANLDVADKIHREAYPTPSGQTRWQLFPQLKHSGRRYTQRWEQRHWSLSRVEAHLAEYVAVRRVSSSGHISLYDHGRYVGMQYHKQMVQVQYDPQAHNWLLSDEHGCELRRHAAPEISREQIDKLTYLKPRRKD